MTLNAHGTNIRASDKGGITIVSILWRDGMVCSKGGQRDIRPL